MKMKKIIHISDLHFGKENDQVVDALLNDIDAYQPDVVIVSGDLTQRARENQFIKAADFLKKITYPKVVVPGNHDVPLYNVIRRFLAPFTRYVEFINDEFFPVFQNDEIAIIGINTAHSFTWKSGKITPAKLKALAQKLEDQNCKIKMLVMHHPFHEIFYKSIYNEMLSDLGIDMIFSGHLHKAKATVLNNHFAMLNSKILIVQAGTSVSRRLRGENNSFNKIEINSKNDLTIIINEYDNHNFFEKSRSHFKKEENCWHLVR
jgi:3',5'-cyclic AMP phosphodiesterase CpdA